ARGCLKLKGRRLYRPRELLGYQNQREQEKKKARCRYRAFNSSKTSLRVNELFASLQARATHHARDVMRAWPGESHHVRTPHARTLHVRRHTTGTPKQSSGARASLAAA